MSYSLLQPFHSTFFLLLFARACVCVGVGWMAGRDVCLGVFEAGVYGYVCYCAVVNVAQSPWLVTNAGAAPRPAKVLVMLANVLYAYCCQLLCACAYAVVVCNIW